MAASKATTNTTNVSSAPSSRTTNNIGHNFHELCRSCGKTNAELYDLFQTTNSPFSTSSTTCYTHLNNCFSSCSTPSLFTTNKPSTSTTYTAAGCANSSVSLTFDSLAATAKASAKGQSNMDNILQEMQIWQLLIKCNDGLPQRICAKCTAQFYMIHKFRRKCLKVQTQLRALYEEQQKFYERQQQQKEKNVTVKDATIEATSTPASLVVALAVPEPALLVEVAKPPVMHKVNDLVNDNYGEPQQAVVDNTNTKASVSFEANTGNTNDFIAPSTTATTTLLENVETMLQKTEANEPTPTSSAPASIDKTFEARTQEHCTVTTGLKLEDEKIPLLKPAVLDSKRSPPLTLQQPLEQICDNDTTTDQTNASKKPCSDQEELLETHVIFKSNNEQNHQSQKNDEELFEKDARDVENISSNSSPSSVLSQANETFKIRLHRQWNMQKDCAALNNANSESLFITKAALKAYTIPPSTSETKNRDYQKPITNSEAIEIKNANDDNNNAHRNICSHRYDNRTELNDNTCSSTSNSTPPSSSSCSSTMSSLSIKQKGTNIPRHKIIKYANHNRRPGHCYKSNATAATTKMARTILSYGGGMVVLRKQRPQPYKHKLKCLPNTETSSTSSRATRRKQRQQEKVKLCHKKSLQQRRDIQMEDGMSSTVSTTSSTPSPSSSPSASSSSSAISSTSLHLRATTPAVTDLVRNCAEVTSYRRNANENINKTACSSVDRLSSNESCIMWKTKAAMKANANDMPIEVVVDNDAEPTTNIPEISLPYTAISTTTVTTTKTTTDSASLLCSSSEATEAEAEAEAEDKSSKTLYENQSINSSITNNNNNLMEKYSIIHNKVMASPDNQVKDTKGESEYLQKATILNRNLWPEEADQNQINTNSPADNEQNTIAVVEKHTHNSDNPGHEVRENPQHVEEKKDEQQESYVLTHPAKVGSMKLIIQRKRGARFKCRRKDDDETPATHDNHEPTAAKRKRKSSHRHNRQHKLEMGGPVFPLDVDYSKPEQDALGDFETTSVDTRLSVSKFNTGNNVAEFNIEEDENKEKPIYIANNYEFDSDSNVSLYRDPLLVKNEMLEEDTHLTDFSKTQLSLQTECSKEMYKLYKEKVNLESPKKLIVRVPLTSLTQDFKKLHLTMEEHQGNEDENPAANEEVPVDSNVEELNEETLCIAMANEQEDLYIEQESSLQANTTSSQSDLLGFSQSTESSPGTADSSQTPMQMKYIEPPLCSASSKINDFINDFQNNCIDSSEIEETCDMIPTLAPHITQELSDEIRDVEDTLNGILSEMHDKDMYTPRSGETDEFLAHSVYSPLTDSPTTPTQSFYAESPCTINSNPMSVSPFIHQNIDYNALTPQSNHSSMGVGSSYMGGGASTGPQTGVYSDHYPSYNECFEESTQSELIGFQNDIPCFENIEMANSTNSNEPQAEINEDDEAVYTSDNSNINSATQTCLNNNVEAIEGTEEKVTSEIVDYVDLSACNDEPRQFVASQPPQVSVDALPEIPLPTPQQIPYSPANYQQLHNTQTLQMPNGTNALAPSTTVTQPHYIVTNTNQGPIIIANPQQLNPAAEQIETSFKPHNNNLQFVTLGQAMEANRTSTNQLVNNSTPKINWPTSVNTTPNYNQQPVLSTTNGTTTYFINANGELYRANIPTANLQNPSVNTIFVPPNTAQTFTKTSIDNTDSYIQAIQQQQRAQQPNNSQSSQYIMLVNNLGGSPQYYATTSHANLNQTVSPQQHHNISTSTVLFHPTQAQNIQNNTSYRTNSPNQSNTEPQKSSNVPITPLESQTDTTTTSGQTIHQKINQQLQKQIKQRQLQNLQPRSPNVTQNITLVCRFCHKRPKFKNNVDYSNHIINTHPAEKPYNCPHCPVHFCRRSERQMHVAQVHGGRYQCAQCGLSFCAQRTLDFHLQKYHANLGRSHQYLQPNSSSTTAPATYQLLQHNQQQRLVRVEDVHVQVTGENKNKRFIDLTLDGAGGGGVVDIKASQSTNEVEIISHAAGNQQLQQQQQQQSRKLCCPDCNGDNDDCCGSNQNNDQNCNDTNTAQIANNSQQYTGNESVNNLSQQHPQHITIPSPEQTEPDSTTTLRHFRKRQLCEISPHFASVSPSSSSSPSLYNNASGNNGGNDIINLNRNSPDNVLVGDGGGEQIVVERALRGSHNCLLCEESFTNEIALRKHHNLAHGAATQSTTCSSATTSMPLVCRICKRGFRMRNALQRHMETHNAEGRPYECNICQVRFPRPSQLTLHKLTVHKFEKPNSCEECGKQFGTESAMKTHAAEHENATNAITAAASETSASSSQSHLSSRFYLDTTTTTTTPSTNEQNINLLSTTSGDDSSASASTNNNDTFNNATQNAVVAGPVT